MEMQSREVWQHCFAIATMKELPSILKLNLWTFAMQNETNKKSREKIKWKLIKLSVQYKSGKFNTIYAKISIQVHLICVLQCKIADKFGCCLWVSLHWPQTPPPTPPTPPPLLLACWVGYANRQTAHHTGISWASVPGPLAMRRRLRLKSKGAGIVELLLLLLLLTHEMIIKTGDSNDSGACRQSAADNTRSHSANWAYCSCRQLVPIATIGRSVDQSVARVESSVRQIRYSNHH